MLGIRRTTTFMVIIYFMVNLIAVKFEKVRKLSVLKLKLSKYAGD